MSRSNVGGILLDIEGTTSSVRFVYDQMFPFVRRRLPDFLESQWETEQVQSCLPLLDTDFNRGKSDWLAEPSDRRHIPAVIRAVNQLMDADSKSTGLKQLQGLVWKEGFESGQLVAHVYEDVPPSLRRWQQHGIDVRIYSSGSVEAQKLFFGHTVAGNLLPLINGHYDTRTGPKQDPGSYRRIADDFDLTPADILFVSDVAGELQAACEAGFQAALSVRPGNAPVNDECCCQRVSSFDQIAVAASSSPWRRNGGQPG